MTLNHQLINKKMRLLFYNIFLFPIFLLGLNPTAFSQCSTDSEPPVLDCLNGLQTIETNTVFAQDFIDAVTDNCTEESNLTYGLQLVDDFTGMMPNELFIDFQEPGIFSVYVWVADEQGNTTYCKTKLLISETIDVEGTIYYDENGDCNKDINETGFNQSVKITLIENGEPTYTTVETSNGGAYKTKIIKPSAADAKIEVRLLIEEIASCQEVYTYDLGINGTENIILSDIGVQLTQGCADLGVTIEALDGSCTEAGFYVINFYNGGNEVANPTIQVDFSNTVNFNRIFATHAYQYAADSEANNAYTFQINNLLPGADGNIFISGQQVCDFVNQTQVINAQISADNACANNWSGAKLEITQKCLGDEVEFKIHNTGQEDMLEAAQFIVVEDVIMRTEGNVQLNAGESETLTFPANGSTFYVKANQVANYPWQATIAKTLEGCTTDASTISTGIVAQFPLENATPHIDVDVVENNAQSYNTLVALPKGVGEDHIVTINTPIEYAIDYANTNNEIANDLTIAVEVSQNLDLSSLKVTYATHQQYDLTIEGQTLNFSFPNIDLVNSAVNKTEGTGLLKFNLAQKADLPEATLIESKVTLTINGKEISSDRNANTFFHTVGQLAFSTSVEDILKEEIGLTVYPNPFHQFTTFEIDNPKNLTLDFELYNANGQLLHYRSFNRNSFNLQRNDLKNGFYFYVVKHEGQSVGAGKLFLE